MFIPLIERPEPDLRGAPRNGGMNTPAPKILIVDDDEDSRMMLKILLEMWNYTIIEAADGVQAISLAETAEPDLILMDVKLPFLDGVEVTRQLRQSAKNGGIPVVFISGYAEPGRRDAALDAGGNEYLVKPVEFELLEAALNKFIPPLRKTLCQ